MLVDLAGLPAGQQVALVLAQDPAPPPGKGDEFGKASPVGLVVIVVLFLATILLIRSMNKHLRKVPASFGESVGASEAGSPGPEGPAPPEVSATPTPASRSGDDSAEEPARD